jgi:hypothetical protein
MEKLAVFKATVVVAYEEDDETPDEALDSWLSDNDVRPRFMLESTEDR